MGISSIVKYIFPGFKKSDFHERLRAVRQDLEEHAVKVTELFLAGTGFKGAGSTVIKNTTHPFNKLFFESLRNLTPNGKAHYAREYNATTSTDDVLGFGLLVNASYSIIQYLHKLERIVDEEFDEVIISSGITYKRSTILQSVALCNFFAKYTTQAIHYMTMVECGDEQDYPKKEKQYLDAYLYTYVKVVDIFLAPVDKIITHIEEIPDVVVDEKSTELLKSTVGSSKLDPLGLEVLAKASIKHSSEGYFSGVATFAVSLLSELVGGMFFKIGTAYVNWQMACYKRNKESKRAIELRVELLKSKRGEMEDPKLEKVIHNYENQIFILAKQIHDMEAKIQV